MEGPQGAAPRPEGRADLALGGDLQETPYGPPRKTPGLKDEGDPLKADGFEGLRLVRQKDSGTLSGRARGTTPSPPPDRAARPTQEGFVEAGDAAGDRAVGGA